MLMASQQGLVVMLMLLLQQVSHNADDAIATG